MYSYIDPRILQARSFHQSQKPASIGSLSRPSIDSPRALQRSSPPRENPEHLSACLVPVRVSSSPGNHTTHRHTRSTSQLIPALSCLCKVAHHFSMNLAPLRKPRPTSLPWDNWMLCSLCLYIVPCLFLLPFLSLPIPRHLCGPLRLGRRPSNAGQGGRGCKAEGLGFGGRLTRWDKRLLVPRDDCPFW